MVGFIAVAGAQNRDDALQRLRRGRGRLLRRANTAQDWAATDTALMTSRVHQSPGGAPSPDTPLELTCPRVVFQGVLYNELELRREPSVGDTGSVEDLLARLYVRLGDEFVSRLDGEFAVLVVDPARRRILAAVDSAGNYPVYWRASDGGVVVGSDLGAVLAATAEPGRLSLPAVADYVTSGMIHGDKTLVRDIYTLDCGQRLSYDVGQSAPRLQQYWDPASLFEQTISSQREYFDATVDAFGRAVSRALGTGGRLGLSLSGGLDSRAILSATGARAASVDTYTLGIRGCADEVIGGRLASIAGTRHTFFPLDDRYLRDFLPNMSEMVSLTGGMYLSHGLTEMLALKVFDEMNVSVLLRGHGGELAKAHLAWPLHTDQHIYTLRSTAELVPYLSARMNYITAGMSLDRLFNPDAAAAAGPGASASLRRVLERTTLPPAACCSLLYLQEHHRRFTVPSLQLFRSKVEVRLPFVDRGFLKVLLGAPAKWRDSTEIHRRITEARAPALNRVRDSNTGAPATAGRHRTFVLDKLNTVLRRLHVPGYRHYHNFDGWMRRTLLDSVQSELLSPGARVLSFVPASSIRAIIAETKAGTVDRSHLLQILLILELWQREHQVEAVA